MTEKHEQSTEEQKQNEATQTKEKVEPETIERQQPDDATSKAPHKLAWFKKISKQTVVAAIIFFVLGGITASLVNDLSHSRKDEAEMTSNKGFREGKRGGEEGQPGMRGKEDDFNEEDAPDTKSGSSKTEKNNGSETSTDESNDTKSQSNA